MPLYSLHADYDRNGVMNASEAEYNFRSVSPGAIILPNLDVDGLALPAAVACGAAAPLDVTSPTKSGGDNDLMRIAVIADIATVTALHNVVFKISSIDAQKLKVYDDGRHLLTGRSAGGFTSYSLNLSAGRTDLFLEASTFNASPSLPPLSLAAMLLSNRVEIAIDVFDIATGVLLESDSGRITISPLILLGDNAPAERLYICENASPTPSLSDNTPSLTDVRNAMRRISGVQLTVVSPAVHNGDTWLQDQFQIGYSQTPSSSMKVVLHLPRLRTDGRLATAAHSLKCMATDHFPSTGLGTFNDFWTRSIPVRDVDQGSQDIPFVNTVELTMLFDRLLSFHDYLMQVVSYVAPSQLGRVLERFMAFDLTTTLRNITDFSNEVIRILNSEIATQTDAVRIQRMRDTITDIRARLPAILSDLSFRADGAVRARTQNLSLALPRDDMDQLYEKLDAIHSSHNYGGNIEVTPAYAGAPLGTVVIGDALGEDETSLVDPQLSSFLYSNPIQPVVRVDTSWLQVGHVDEVVNFVAAPGSTQTFAAMLASPLKAQQILEEIFILNTADLSDMDPLKELYGRPYSFGDQSLARGPHPVTKMLRGKHWLQSYPTPNDFRLGPPEIYTWMNSFYGDIGAGTRRYYPIPWADDHHYDASLTVREMLFFSRHSSRQVEEKIDEMRNSLSRQFSNQPLIELPVFFDEYAADRGGKTIAFTPDLVNFQTLNDHVLMPRPYGPRMSNNDTIEVLKKVLDKSLHHKLKRQYFIQKDLNRTFHWAVDTINELSHVITGPYNRPVTVNLDWLAEQFKDGFFPESDLDVIKRRIRTARFNAGKFMPNGNLRRGWHLVEIPENKIDVFEAYTQIMVESCDMKIDWVDSWYYHIRSGGIHCGTNVIRTPNLTAANAWWNLTRGYGPGDYPLPSRETMYA